MGAVQLLKGIAYGAGMMYLLDPDLGRRRRALLFDKLIGGVHQLDDGLETALADAANRIEGFWYELQNMAAPRTPVSDVQLEARVRSKLGRVVSFPRALEVSAANGHVTLRGPVLRSELDSLLSAVASVRGVAVVDNQLEPHDEPADVPGLQGQPRRSPATAQFDWSPGARLAAFSVGSLLMARCARHPTPLNVLLGTAGFGLFARAATTVGRTRPAPKAQPAPAEPAVSAR